MGRGSCVRHGGEETILVGNLKERVCLEALAVDGKKISMCISKTEDLVERIGLNWWRRENVVGSFEHGNKSAGCVRCVTFLDQLRNC
jgi:hypothetical protein